MKIQLESLCTPYTLDSYQTFTFDNVEDQIIEDLNEYNPKTGLERKNPLNLNYDDIEWTYNKKGYLKALAVGLINLLNDNILDDVIKSVKSDCKVISPMYYNFETDKIFIDFDVDMKALHKYINAHDKDYQANKLKSISGFMWFGNEYQTMLNYYLENVSAKKYVPFDCAYYDMVEQVDAIEFIDYKII